MPEIDTLDVNPKIIDALKRAKVLDFKSILTTSHGELVRTTKLSQREVALLVKAASRSVVQSKIVPANQLLEKDNLPMLHVDRVSVGCKVLDLILKGGIPTRGITEICGESASGKTQICLQLALCAQLPVSQAGLGSGVVYICTECTFPDKRLQQLITELEVIKSANLPGSAFSDNIFICKIGDVADLKQCVEKYLPVLIRKQQIRVVIIDSVAAVFRAEYNNEENLSRARNLQSLGYSLHCLAEKERLAVVCVNQVTDVLEESHAWCGPIGDVAPALGLSWANLVSTRLMLSRTRTVVSTICENGQELNLPVPAIVCKLRVLFAPDLPNNSACYVITESGVKGIDATTCGRIEAN